LNWSHQFVNEVEVCKFNDMLQRSRLIYKESTQLFKLWKAHTQFGISNIWEAKAFTWDDALSNYSNVVNKVVELVHPMIDVLISSAKIIALVHSMACHNKKATIMLLV